MRWRGRRSQIPGERTSWPRNVPNSLASSSISPRLSAPPLRVTIPNPGHPELAESLIPFWGSEKEAIADYYDGDFVGAVGNAVLATDIIPAKAVGQTIVKGGFKAAPTSWRTARKALGKEGFAAPGQPLHHWLIEQRSALGKLVPGHIKNQKWNLLPMPDAATHGRLSHKYKDLKEFNPIEKFRYGLPIGVQVTTADALGHALMKGKAEWDKRKPPK
jgi:hypothetical protein